MKNQRFAIFMTLPFMLAVPPILGWFIGKWLDAQFHSASLFRIIFLILGFLAGARECWRLIKTYGDL